MGHLCLNGGAVIWINWWYSYGLMGWAFVSEMGEAFMV